MKRRRGWVANSSSSSFVVIGTDVRRGTDYYVNDSKRRPTGLIIPKDLEGQTEFDRQDKDFKDLGSRVNWAFLLALQWDVYSDNLDAYSLRNHFWNTRKPSDYRNLTAMLRGVLKKQFNVDYIRCHLSLDSDDHVSDFVRILQDPDDPVKLLPTHLEYGYIDHGSCIAERPGNLGIFDRTDTLVSFLFAKDSFIANRSDETDGMPYDSELYDTFYYKMWYGAS